MFQTHYSRMAMPYEQRVCEATLIKDKSKTVPDMTLSLRQLVERYVQRREVPTMEGVYLAEDSVLNDFTPEYMDAEERLEFAVAIQSVVSDELRERKKPKTPAAAPAAVEIPAEHVRDDVNGI